MFKKLFILSTFAIFIAACGGGGGGTPTPTGGSTTLNTTINSFTITGTGVGAGGKQEINANITGGNFVTQWDVSTSDPYRIDLYVSENATLEKASDIRFFGKNCGSGPLLECTGSGRFDCRFTTQNKISCGIISATNPEKDLTGFLTALPMDAYIIIEACNGLVTSCKEAAVLVEFQ